MRCVLCLRVKVRVVGRREILAEQSLSQLITHLDVRQKRLMVFGVQHSTSINSDATQEAQWLIEMYLCS